MASLFLIRPVPNSLPDSASSEVPTGIGREASMTASAVSRAATSLRALPERYPSQFRKIAVGAGLGRDIATKSEARKFGAQRQLALGACPLLKAGKPAFGLGVEIAGRDGRIGIPLARDEAGDVAQIFPLQRQGVVFRMPLKEDEMAAQLLGEDIDAGLRRFGQHLIAPGRQVALAQRVEARMRNLERRGDILRQPMVADLGAVEDTRAFCVEPLPLDAVEMQDRGMGGKARPDRRTRIGFRPVDDLGEVLPERLLGKGCGVRLGAGDDQPVDLQVIEIGDVGVLPVDPPLRRLRSLDGRQREAVQNGCDCCPRPPSEGA